MIVLGELPVLAVRSTHCFCSWKPLKRWVCCCGAVEMKGACHTGVLQKTCSISLTIWYRDGNESILEDYYMLFYCVYKEVMGVIETLLIRDTF